MAAVSDDPTTAPSDYKRQSLELLPGSGSAPGEYEAAVQQIIDRVEERALLDTVLAELWRRQQPPGDDGDEIALAAETLQAHLLKRDRDRVRKAVERRRARDAGSLQARMLYALAGRRRTPSQLATELGVAKETASRSLKALAASGLVSFVVDQDDARRRLYHVHDGVAGDLDVGPNDRASLTPEGELRHDEDLQYGPPIPRDRQAERQAVEQYVSERIDDAVQARRRVNKLDAATATLKSLVRTAEQAGFASLEVRARRELATTLRQAGQQPAHRAEVGRIRKIAHGERADLGPGLLLAAFGHYTYEEGRRTATGEDLGTPLRKLVASMQTFEQLRALEPGNSEWPLRKAWSAFAVADACRDQTRLDAAIDAADTAAASFESLNDDYGLASSIFLVGFCLRLQGEFGWAEQVLHTAHDITEERQFDRLRAQCLLQLGETYRCQGRPDQALPLLTEASERASELGHAVTVAFAQASLGAWAYERGERRAAVRHIKAAIDQFRRRRHRTGLALGYRRRAFAELGQKKHIRLGDEQTASALRDLRTAQHGFERLGSPAGAIGCQVGRVQVQIAAGASVAEVDRGVEAVVGWFKSSPRNYAYVARDPWAPRLISQLLTDSNHQSLKTVTERLALHVETERSTRRTGQLYVRRFLGRRAQAAAMKWVRAEPTRKAALMAGESQVCVDDRLPQFA
jgi:tetratricopeptide (TPR) repeat protein